MAITNVFSAQNLDIALNVTNHNPTCYESKIKLFEKQMDEFISKQMEKYSAVGFSIAVVENNKVVYEKGFGYADKENKIPVDSSTLFHIGSITKVFTGIAIMQLAQKGLIDIDEPIQRYIPEFSIKYHTYFGRPITIRSIMSHQSGIFGDKLANFADTVYPATDFRNFPEFAKNEYAAYYPNYITAYSNFAVSLLGLIIERVSHQKYEQYIYNNILKPCGMTETGFNPRNENESLLAKGYDSDGNLYPYYYIDCIPAGFLASNSNNMAKFIKIILNHGFSGKNWVLYPSTLNYMYKPQSKYVSMNLYDEYTSPFGLSWMLENKSFNYMGKVVGHGGYLPPYNSNLLIATDKRIGVFVTSNKDDFYPSEISYFALVEAGKIFRNLQKPDLPAVPHITTLPEYQKKFCTGTYCILGSNPIEIYSENDTLYYHELHSERIPLVYHVDGWFSFCINNTIIPGTRWTIKYIDGQKVLCVEGRNSFSLTRDIIGNNFIPKDTLSAELQKITGLYSEMSSR